MKSMIFQNRLKSTNRDSSSKHTWPIKLFLILITSNRVVHKELCFPTSTSAIYYCLYLKVPFSFKTIQQAICQWSATGGPWAKTGPPAIISGPCLQPDYFDRLFDRSVMTATVTHNQSTGAERGVKLCDFDWSEERIFFF